ncbi:MarR family transcriptional regulator [Holzapfeliella sp. He02]|uniref:MarR family transcriptional regulator n=1 Tax=Holzapfeliella saturejae TaxID=3082953 RepID=A0ABU8SF68_9LACO
MKKNMSRLLKIASNNLTRSFNTFAAQYDLTSTQMSILDFISLAKGPTLQKEIEHEFVVKRSTATNLLKLMEKKDLIYRLENPDDSRQKFIYLTEKSKSLLDSIKVYMKQEQVELYDNFSIEELKTFEKILNYYINK